jgi:hypothetical protein
MAGNERESGTPEDHDPIRAYATQNVEQEAAKPRSSAGPFLVSLLITAVILAIAFYVWGR